MLNISEEFFATVRQYGRKRLVIAFDLAGHPRHERIMITDAGVYSRRPDRDSGAVLLYRRTVVPGFIKERAAQERTPCIGYLITEACVNCCVPGIGVDVDQSTLRWRNQGVTLGAR